MKKTVLINAEMSAVVAQMGHLDTLVVADAGLPVPEATWRIDLALRPGVPGFLQVVETVLSELRIERAIVADELADGNPDFFADLRGVLGDVPIDRVTHAQFKQLTPQARAIVRTGEFTPYANVILVAGVVF